MGIQFTSNAPANETEHPEVCICSQMAPGWCYPCDHIDSIRDELREYADPHCPLCGGSGVDNEKVSDLPEIDWNQGNALSLFLVLGLPVEDGLPVPYGEMTLPEARRAIMRARGRGDLLPYAREEETQYGAPREGEGGVVELRPLRSFCQGLPVEGVKRRLNQFEQFVSESAARGATQIRWH
jgi:hypothetical protein